MKATFYGIGYVGLVQAAVLADAGHHICCVDIDEKKITDLKNGIIPIYEPELTSLVDRNHLAGRLRFTTSAEEGVKFSDIQFIAVGTPPDEDGSADLKYVLQVAETIATHMQASMVIVDKSTVPVGTADMVKAKITEVLASRDVSISYSVVSNPEFLKEGAAVKDCQRPDRIIIGTDSEAAEEAMRELYAPFNRNHDKIIVMDIRSAELTKYAANCMLATKISFMNEIANIAEQVGADIEQVRHGIGSDPRIGYQFIYPGCGYGGSCFPKDVQALIHTANTLDYKPEILEAVEAVNNRQKNKLFDYVCRHFGVTEQKKTGLHNKTFALWGLSFKPNTDDMREAPSRALMESLWAADAKVQAYDPQAMEEARRIYGEREDFILCDSKEAALDGADALLICTEWQSFRAPEFEQIMAVLNEPLIFDGRNIFDPEKMAELGFSYYAIGRGLSVTGGKT
ncbi:MAG: UDP-glucose 6-dehydrogenase [Gammaproteobacteria bacterium]|nr:UDP-glucose 6-dehydrogenase [Gammaproteobacteria bacterium]